MGETFGGLLYTFRSAALLSQEELAERSGVSARTISDIERGSARTPRLVTVVLLAEAMNLSPVDRSRLQEAARKPTTAPAGLQRTAALRPVTLIGREPDVAKVSALLSRDDTRLLTLVGPAGVGKTSLATHVAIEGSDGYELGAVMVELAPIAEPSLVSSAVARAFGIQESETDVIDAIKAYVRERTALLFLDNLEHLAPAAALIAALLNNSPKLKILATSREALHLHAEKRYPVRPLDNDAAAAMFVQRAQMVKPDFEPTPENDADIQTILRHLEGLPLAIELAAPRLLHLSPKALAGRLQRRLPMLSGGTADRPDRQQTMRGAIGWSYDLLSPEEQRLFRHIAVLRGGGRLEAVASVAHLDGAEHWVLRSVAQLVDKNLVLLLEDARGEPRVSMFELLREYARERLIESGELADARRRHAEYVFDFAQRNHVALSGSAQRDALASFEIEHANIAAALEWAASTGELEFGFQLLGAAWRFWWARGHLVEGATWMRRFFALRRSSPGSIPERLYAIVLYASAVLLALMGNFDESQRACEEAIALQRRLDDEGALAASLTELGLIWQFRGEYERAEEAYDEGLAIQRRLGDDAGAAASLSGIASAAFGKRDFTRAAELGEQSVTIYRRLGHDLGVIHALTKVGLAAYGERRYERAGAIFEECLRAQRAVGNTGTMYFSIANLGTIAHKIGDYELALQRYHEAFDLLDCAPNADAQADLLEGIAATFSALRDPARAARLFGAAEAARRTLGTARFAPDCEDYEADVAAVRAQLGEETFNAQWQIGAGMTLEHALAEVRATWNAT